jgi:hypothetical protein
MRRDRARVARRVATISDSDLLTLIRSDRNDEVTITWRDAVSQIIASVAESRQTLVDAYNAMLTMFGASIDWVVQQLTTKADIGHRHVAADVDGIAGMIATAINSEVAARSYADTQEGQARVSGDAALNLRVKALEDTRVRKFAADFGNGLLTSYTFNHGLGTSDIVVQVYSKANGLLLAPSTISKTASQVTVTFVLAVGASANRIVVIG